MIHENCPANAWKWKHKQKLTNREKKYLECKGTGHCQECGLQGFKAVPTNSPNKSMFSYRPRQFDRGQTGDEVREKTRERVEKLKKYDMKKLFEKLSHEVLEDK